MSIQRGCQFCGKRLRGVVPGAMTIELDGAPPDAAIVLCTEHAIEVRRVLDELRHRSIVAQHARAVDITQPQTRIAGAPTELFPLVGDTMPAHLATLPPGTLRRSDLDEQIFEQEAHGRWPQDRSARLPVPLSREPARRPTPLLGWRKNREQQGH